MKCSHSKRIFNCDNCPHEYLSSLSGVSKKNRGCPYCCHPRPQKLCSDDNCTNCYNNSFASSLGKTSNGKLKVDCWSDKNKKTPREIFICTGLKYWFKCDNCPHEFDIGLDNLKIGRWCPKCRESKGNRKISDFLQLRNIKDNAEIKFTDCKDKKCMPFDNAIIDEPDYPIPILIEYDGEQHFGPHWKGGYKSLLKTQKHDYIKSLHAIKNNYILVRISYLEFEDIEKWIDKALKMSQENSPDRLLLSNPYLYRSLSNKLFYSIK